MTMAQRLLFAWEQQTTARDHNVSMEYFNSNRQEKCILGFFSHYTFFVFFVYIIIICFLSGWSHIDVRQALKYLGNQNLMKLDLWLIIFTPYITRIETENRHCWK